MNRTKTIHVDNVNKSPLMKKVFVTMEIALTTFSVNPPESNSLAELMNDTLSEKRRSYAERGQNVSALERRSGMAHGSPA